MDPYTHRNLFNSQSNLFNSNEKNIRIYSYNSRGFDLVKQKFCRDLLCIDNNVIPILCNQENFTLKGNCYIIRKALPDCHIMIKPASKDCLEGRPKNGMFVAIPAYLRSKAKYISPNCSRVQAILLHTDNETLMIINTYFPTDPRTARYQVDSELEDVLAAIENVIDTYQCNNVMIAGDLNTDFLRKNGRVNRVETFLLSKSLESSWKRFKVDYTHEFEMNEITYTSTIDHVLWNECFSQNVINAGVLHLPGNTSDHIQSSVIFRTRVKISLYRTTKLSGKVTSNI